VSYAAAASSTDAKYLQTSHGMHDHECCTILLPAAARSIARGQPPQGARSNNFAGGRTAMSGVPSVQREVAAWCSGFWAHAKNMTPNGVT
jgi:hypothetical protein